MTQRNAASDPTPTPPASASDGVSAQEAVTRPSFYILTAGLTLAILILLGVIGLRMLASSSAPQSLDSAIENLPPGERREIYVEAAREAGYLYDSIPEPDVARLGKPGIVLTRQQAEIRINAAGLRSDREYGPRASEEFRIVCVGDSIVFGAAGPQQDRFCNQIEDYYSLHGIKVDGKRITTLALALGSWTLVQEATYLTSRLSAYEPDIIILLSVANDISDIWGVTGSGFLTNTFTPEYRSLGSSVFLNRAGTDFGFQGFTALVTGIGSESDSRWRKSMRLLSRLVDLQEARGGKTLVSVFNDRPLFELVYKTYYLQQPVRAPLLTTAYFAQDPSNRLAHDPHPSRKGHHILASHYILALDALGWVPLPEDPVARPPLHEGLSVSTETQVVSEDLHSRLEDFVDRHVESEIDFTTLSGTSAGALLGGLLAPWKQDGSPPWGTLKTGWLMRATSKAQKVLVEISIPSRVELFPFHLSAAVNGSPRSELTLRGSSAAGRHRLEIPLRPEDPQFGAVEILLEAKTYFTEITDHRMRSYHLLNAKVIEQ